MKKSVLSVLLLCATPSILPVTTGLSCLYNPKTQQKIAIIHDSFYGYKGSPDLVSDQVKELTSLVDALSTRKVHSAVLCDCSAFTLAALQQGANLNEVLLTIPKIFAVQGSNKKGNTSFDIFGNWNNNGPDRIVKTWYLDSQTPEMILDTTKGHTAVPDPELTCERLTIGLYLDYLGQAYKRRIELLDKLPPHYVQLAQQIKSKLTGLYTQLDTAIREILVHSPFANVKDYHIVYLLESQLRNWNYDLLQKISKVVAYQQAIDLLSQIVANSAGQVIVHCGNLSLVNYWLVQAGFAIVDEDGDSVLATSEDEALSLSICTPVCEDFPSQEDPYTVELNALFDIDQLVLGFLAS